jgi:uncharacterized damage-inducible protein DinB
MSTQPTTQLLGQLAAQTEAMLQKAVSSWQMMTHQQFAQKPAPDAWSANQCLQHLNSYSNYYLPQLEKAFAGNNGQKPAQQFTSGWLGGYFTRLLQPPAAGAPVKKMKAPANHTPHTTLPSHQVIAAFIDNQEKLLQLINNAASVNLGTTRVPISIARFIRLRAGDVLAFVVAHQMRHVAQAERALQAAKASVQPV